MFRRLVERESSSDDWKKRLSSEALQKLAEIQAEHLITKLTIIDKVPRQGRKKERLPKGCQDCIHCGKEMTYQSMMHSIHHPHEGWLILVNQLWGFRCPDGHEGGEVYLGKDMGVLREKMKQTPAILLKNT